MTKALFIIAPKGFQDRELLDTRQILNEAGVETKVASLTTETAEGSLGTKIVPDLAISDIILLEYDLIVFIGGPGALELAKEEEVTRLLTDLKVSQKKIGAICIAPVLLARAGILEGKKATVYQTEDSVKELKSNGAELVPKSVVTDGKIVTANGPAAAKAFGQALLELLDIKPRQ